MTRDPRTPTTSCATPRCRRRPQRGSASGLCRTCHDARYAVPAVQPDSPDRLIHGQWVRRPGGIKEWVVESAGARDGHPHWQAIAADLHGMADEMAPEPTEEED